MTWRCRTYHVGGGDMPLDSVRFYTYWFYEDWKAWFRPTKAKFSMPFWTEETNSRGDENGHKMVLQEHPFFINGRDVMEWAESCVTGGFASLTFRVDNGVEAVLNKGPVLTLHTKFSDKGIASLFKLTFGGKF